MIEVKITYGTDIAADAPTLRRLAAALLVLAGDNATTVTASSAVANVVTVREPKTPLPTFDPVAGGPVQGNSAPGWSIAPNDVPDVGADVEPDPAQVFGGAADPDPAAVFGLGNGAAGSGIASSAMPVSINAGSSSAATNAAAVNAPGEQGNVPGATSPTPNGTPAVPNNGAATGGVNVDSRGLPWDVRIHAGTKTTNKDGSWKKKPNVDPAFVAQVETELRAVMAIPATGNAAAAPIDFVPTGAPATPPVPAPPPPTAVAPVGNVATPTPPVSAPTTAAGVASSITGFAQLLAAVTNGISVGQITEAQVAAALAKVGVAVLPQIAPRNDLVALVAADLFPGQ